MKTIAAAGAAALLLVFSFPSASQAMPGAQGRAERPSDPGERFALIDADHDGKLSWEEFSAARPNINRNAFDTIDANGDGGICLDEWKAFSAGHGASMKSPDMSGMMKSMRGAGDGAAPAPAGSGSMPLVMPPARTPAAPSENAAPPAMPLITPPAEGK